jgi:hypothetical protein
MDQTQVKEDSRVSTAKQTGVPHARFQFDTSSLLPPKIGGVGQQTRRGVSVEADGRSGQSSDRQRSILIGFFPQSQVPQSNCEPTAPRAHGMSESDVFSQPAIARPFPHSHWAIDDCSCLRKSCVQVEKCPAHHFQQETESKSTTPTLVGPATPVSATSKDDSDRRGS